jgi:hypothetical protein
VAVDLRSLIMCLLKTSGTQRKARLSGVKEYLS